MKQLCFIFIRFILIFLLYLQSIQSSHTEAFLKKAFLEIFPSLQENTCTGVYVLGAVSKFINEETPAQCSPKPLTVFTKSFIVDVRLGYKYASVLPLDPKPTYKDFLLWKSEIKIATALYSSDRFII